jgi:hypothetical protein
MPYQEGDPKVRTNKNTKNFTGLQKHHQESTNDSNKRRNKIFVQEKKLNIDLYKSRIEAAKE